MPRKLQPCGTRAAYARHLYNKEEPCTDCKAANMIRVNSAPSGGKRYEMEASAALEANPPVIVWRRKNNGVWVAISIQDPHAEKEPTRREARSRSYADKRFSEFPISCEQGHEFDSWNTIVTPDGTFECRICTAHTENAPLMASARRPI